MSVTSLGIPLPLGQALRPENVSTCPAHCTIGPSYFTILFATDNYFQISAVTTAQRLLTSAGNNVTEDLFSLFKLSTIDANIKLANVIDGSTLIQNSELNTYVTIEGKINLQGIAMGTDNFKALVCEMTREFKRELDTFVGSDLVNTDNLDLIIYNTLIQILKQTYQSFILTNESYSKFDISAYINLINSCFASFANSIVNYQKSGVIDNQLSVDAKLKQIDPDFYTLFKADEVLLQAINTIIDIIFNILIKDGSDTLFNSLRIMNNQTKKIMGNGYKSNDFNTFVCGKIGALCELAYLFSCVENVSPSTKTSLLMVFALPQKFVYV